MEWDKDTKEVVWSWNTFDHFSMADYDQYGGTWDQAYFDLQYDWTHVNAAFFSDEEDALYISTRHLSRITKIDYESGNVGHSQLVDQRLDAALAADGILAHGAERRPRWA